MGQSKILSSLHEDYWVDENLLSIESLKDDNKYDILNSAVDRYSIELQSFSGIDTKVDNIDDSESAYPVLDLPDFSNFFSGSNSKKYSKKIQSWKGIVLSRNTQSFKAKLYDLNAGGTYEVGEFENEDVSPDDLDLLRDGAIFYWSVGHYMENGQSVKRSDIRFQRLITLDIDEFEETKRNIESKYSNLKERRIDNS